MDRATLLVIALLSLLVVASAGNGNFSTQNSSHPIAEATGQNQDEETPQPCPCQRTALCCRLGRKAVRLSYTASVYTCKIEALAQGLKYQKAASHRLFKSNTGQADRMDATNTLRMSYGFRWRLKLCETQGKVQKRCFQECCERRLKEEQARAKIVRPQAKPKSSSSTKAKEKDEKRP